MSEDSPAYDLAAALDTCEQVSRQTNPAAWPATSERGHGAVAHCACCGAELAGAVHWASRCPACFQRGCDPFLGLAYRREQSERQPAQGE